MNATEQQAVLTLCLMAAFADGGKELHLTLPQPSDEPGAEALAEFMGTLVLWMMDVTLEALDVAEA